MAQSTEETNMKNDNANIHYEYEEIIIARKKTITFATDNKNIKPVEVLTYLQGLNYLECVECFQTIMKENLILYEITCKSEVLRSDMEKKLNRKMCINNIVLNQVDNRELKDIIKKPLITVVIYEAPHELEDIHIINKLKTYGEIKGEVSRHKIRGTNILNGNRSIDFTTINESIPTTLHIKGNKIKIKYPGQDRTPICSFCRQKGHYKLICEKYLKLQKEYENREIEEENIEENEMEESITSDIEANNTWAQIVEKNDKKKVLNAESEKSKTISTPKHKENNINLTQRLQEIQSFQYQQVKFKPTKKMTEEEEKEMKKRKKAQKAERRRLREQGELVTTDEEESLWNYKTMKEDTFGIP